MKKISTLLVLSWSITAASLAEENSGLNLYTFFLNIVNESFNFPLIGFVNIAVGSHTAPQIGFVNWNTYTFISAQIGFINTAGGGMQGVQASFVNTAAGNVQGVQAGYVNTAAGSMQGVQTGFINTVTGGARGVQAGFVNTAVKSFAGAQIGFINTAASDAAGAQVSFVNIAKQLTGLQFGFINYADSINKGIPIGFLSIVRKGGYKAVELGVSDISPFNASFKIGAEAFYTSFSVSYNPFKDGIREQIIWGAGFGSLIKIGTLFFINPEITGHNAITKPSQQYVSFVPYFGFNLFANLSVAAGPSLVWHRSEDGAEKPFYHIIRFAINGSNTLYAGARAGLRFRF
jgi:hypothetical protein